MSMVIGVQRQTDMNPIIIEFAGINDHLHSRGFLSRLREPTTAEAAIWPEIKHILKSMGEVVDNPERRFLQQDDTESYVRAVSGVSTSPRWTKVRVCDSGFALGRKV